jgi:hypothetical protein
MSPQDNHFPLGRARLGRAVIVVPEIESGLDGAPYQHMAEVFRPVNLVISSLPSFLISVWVCCALLLPRAAHAAQPDPDIARFISAKSNQVYLASRDSDKPVPPEVWKMFSAASAADWNGASNLFHGILTAQQHSSGSHRLAPEVWGRVQEVGVFSTTIPSYNLKFIRLFAHEIFKLIPPGGIFISGSDAGRIAITALSTSQEEGKPFMTVAQDDLFDNVYLDYVRGLYRQQAKLPDAAAADKATSEYTSDLMQRWQHDQQFPNEPKQVLPGEEIRTVDGKTQIGGLIPFTAITAKLVRDILNDNPEREVYFEPYRLDEWAYAYLEPAGPIFKMRHAPADTLFEETVRSDREYWQRLTRRLIGVVVHDDMNLAEICAAAQDLAGKPKDFQGDPEFLKDENARLLFSKLRSAGGAVYAWRMMHAKSTSERRQMEREAELAFRQAYLLCPRSKDAIMRYLTFFTCVQRKEDLEKFAGAAEKLLPRDDASYIQQWADWWKTQN